MDDIGTYLKIAAAILAVVIPAYIAIRKILKKHRK